MRRRLMGEAKDIVCTITRSGTTHYFESYEDASDYAYSTSSTMSLRCVKGDIPEYFLYVNSSAPSCTWSSITICNDVTSIGQMAFHSANYSSSGLTINGTDCTIGNNAFEIMAIGGTLTINDGITSIGQLTFSQTSITRLILPSTLEHMGILAFGLITTLSDVSFYGTSDIDWSEGAPFGASLQVSVIKVPTNYSGSTFCGVTVSKVL